MRLQILDRDDCEIPIESDAVHVEEANRYRLLVRPADAATRAFLGAVELDRVGDVFPIPIDHWVGRTELRVESSDLRRILAVEVLPREEKLSEDLWLELLGDLETWLPGLTVGAEGGKKGEVGAAGTDRATPQLIVEALHPLFPALERAIRALLRAPREQLATVPDDISIRKIRRVEGRTLAWLGRHPEVGAWLDPWLESELQGEAPLVPVLRKEVGFDHPANEYVAWLVGRVQNTLRQTASRLEDAPKGQGVSADGELWCRSRAALLRDAAARLERIWKRGRLARVARRPLSEAALQVILDDPVYLRVHRLGRLFLDPRFMLSKEPSETAAAVRPSYTLYELWCFLEVARQLKQRLPEFDWRERNLGNLLTLTGSGTGASIRGEGASGRIVVDFNVSFSGYFARKGGARWSLSAERRPDIVVTWKPVEGDPTPASPSSEGAWISLDAKYRAGKSNLGQALESAHIYKDSLLYDGFGGRCRASVLLAPSRTADCEAWFSAEFFEEHREGVWQLRPGGGNDVAVADRIVEALGMSS